MTTDTKAVARFYWSEDEMQDDRGGDYVLFTDHERVVGELTSEREKWRQLSDDYVAHAQVLRDALAASRAEVEGLRAEVEKSIQWECLIAWLIENCEGETISEELLTKELAKMLSDVVKTRGNV